VQAFRAPTNAESAVMQAILNALARINNLSVGTLHRNEGAAMERHDFETLVSALVRAGMVTIRADVFEKDGKSIPFNWLTLTRIDAKSHARTLAAIQVPAKQVPRRKGPSSRAKPKTRTKKNAALATPQSSRLDAALRAWRKGEATKRRVPAFRIMTDKALLEIATSHPKNEAALLAVHGVGPSLVAKHGAKILQIVRNA
jgi:DNA topoisomerase-3